MRSKSRFTTLVLLETRESYLQIRVQSQDTRTLSTSSKCHLRVRRFIEPSHRVCRRIPQFPPWGAQRPVGVKLRRTQSEHMFSALPPELGHCSSQSACLKRANRRHCWLFSEAVARERCDVSMENPF